MAQKREVEFYCMAHPGKDLEFYCVDCQMLICMNCKLTKHIKHETQDLAKAAITAKVQLTNDKVRFQEKLNMFMKHISNLHNDQKALAEKYSSLKKVVRERHSMIVSLVDRYRDETLSALNKMEAEANDKTTEERESVMKHVNIVKGLKQMTRHALDSGSQNDLVSVGKEMRFGRGSHEALSKMEETRVTFISSPVLHCSPIPATFHQEIYSYFGSPVEMVMDKVEPPEVTVMEKFRCWNTSDTRVFYLCPKANGLVCISFEPSPFRKDNHPCEFSESGKLIHMYPQFAGLTSIKINGDNTYFSPPPTSKCFVTYVKSEAFWKLSNHLTGQADIVKVNSLDRYLTEDVVQFTINCTKHRAVDINATKDLFVVLEEGDPGHNQRHVRLYQSHLPDPIDTYIPPLQPCQPSDVCFYRLGVQEVVLVADELNDAIHVLDVRDGHLRFSRYLAPGCPLLVQPTALNTDFKGRLWVACGGGHILNMERICY